MSEAKFTALIDYEDRYVQPLIVEAFKSKLPENCYELSTSSSDTAGSKVSQLQIRAYEAIDFDQGLSRPDSLFNAYIIRKALIRKHYLSNTIFSWVTKNPDSPLKDHFKPAVDFELDYAEFLDDALVEAFELRASFERNEGKEANGREWWILKPGMSDRGQGIRLFSTEEELTTIFEDWEAQNPDDDDDDEDAENEGVDDEAEDRSEGKEENNTTASSDYIVTSHLRHFIAQPYIHPPLLIAAAPYNNRKFHIRTYVVAAGALNVYVYSHMLALFASEPYVPPWETTDTDDTTDDADTLLRRMQNVHLTNTCVQTANDMSSVSDNNPVHLLSHLPLSPSTHTALHTQINTTISALFSAALAHPTNFQPLPQSFEVFGVDFLVDEEEKVWLLEVNAFPDFAQTGEELREVVVKGLWEEIMEVVVAPFFGVGGVVGEEREEKEGKGVLERVLEVDFGR